jgi:hypothetical protein
VNTYMHIILFCIEWGNRIVSYDQDIRRVRVRCFHWRHNVVLSVRPSVSLSTHISAAVTERTFLKFYIGDFYENVSRNSRFG